MFAFLINNWGTIVVSLILILIVFLCIRSLWKKRGDGCSSCGGSCGGCGGSCGCKGSCGS